MNTRDILKRLWGNVVYFVTSKVLVTILLVLSGILTAFIVLQLLSNVASPQKAKSETPAKDTVYVKLVDSQYRTSFVPVSTSSKQETMVDTGGNQATGPVDTLKKQGTSVSTTKAPPITAFTNTQLHPIDKNRISYWKWLVIPSLLIFVGLGIFLSYKKLPLPNYKLNTDKDPPELTNLFDRKQGMIEQLGNPRKIKRFSNKLRFQYHYLKNQGLIKSDRDLDTILVTLIYIENNRQQMNLDKLSVADKLNTLQWFKNLVSTGANVQLEDSLAKHLLQLNKNVIA